MQGLLQSFASLVCHMVVGCKKEIYTASLCLQGYGCGRVEVWIEAIGVVAYGKFHICGCNICSAEILCYIFERGAVVVGEGVLRGCRVAGGKGCLYLFAVLHHISNEEQPYGIIELYGHRRLGRCKASKARRQEQNCRKDDYGSIPHCWNISTFSISSLTESHL